MTIILKPLFFDLLCCAFLLAVDLLLDRFLSPFKRPFRLDDYEISHKNLENFVPIWSVYVIGYGSFLLAVLIYLRIYAYITAMVERRLSRGKDAVRFDEEVEAPPDVTLQGLDNPTLDINYEFHKFAIGLTISLMFTIIATDIVKNFAGRLRPDFLDRCQFKPFNNATFPPNYYVFEGVDGTCIGDTAKVLDGRKSFFSGHTSSSFVMATFAALWILRSAGVLPFSKLRNRYKSTLNNGKPVYFHGSAFRIFLGGGLALSCLALASYVGISR
ncbi:hypothetical protein HK098_006748 [Nowakowskiella sp. JEL0407]|nr:hypothetical protein HK098_006748 [Nowakowskiella sp. JEL0407]